MSGPEPIFDLAEVDPALGAALPAGWLGLLRGGSGTGVTLLAKQFAHAGAGRVPVRYYSTYERTDDVARAFRDFGWKSDGVRVVNLSDEYYDRVLRRDVEVSRTREAGLTFRDLAGSPTVPLRRRTYNLQNRLLSDLADLDGPFRLVLDSLDFFLEVLESSEVLMLARQTRHLAQQLGGQVVLVIQPEIHERRTTGLLEDMADLVVDLASSEPGGAEGRSFLVRKVRNHPEHTRSVPMRVTDRGLALVPPAEPKGRERSR